MNKNDQKKFSCLAALLAVCLRPRNLSPEADSPVAEAERLEADKQTV